MDEAADNNVKHFDGNPQNNINILILRQLSKAFPDSLGKEFLFRYICTNDNKITTYEVNIALSELLDTKLIEHTNPKPTNPLLALTVLFQEEPHFKITTEGLESFKQKTIDHPITHHQIEDGGNRVTKQDTPQRLEKPTSVQKPSTSNADIEVKKPKKRSL